MLNRNLSRVGRMSGLVAGEVKDVDFCPCPALGPDHESLMAVVDEENACHVVDWRTGGDIRARVSLQNTPVRPGGYAGDALLVRTLTPSLLNPQAPQLHVYGQHPRLFLSHPSPLSSSPQLSSGSIRRVKFSRASPSPLLLALVVAQRRTYLARFALERYPGSKDVKVAFVGSSRVVDDIATSFDVGRGDDSAAFGTAEGEVFVFRCVGVPWCDVLQ